MKHTHQQIICLIRWMQRSTHEEIAIQSCDDDDDDDKENEETD